MLMYLAFVVPFMILGFVAQRRVTGTFATWSEVRSSSGRTGAEVARAILDRNGLQDVEVLHTPGVLSDHYDPRKRTVNLSDPVFNANSVAAVSVGVIDGEPRLDLPYEEDVRAETDMNVVMTGDGKFIEVQGTAEGAPFDRAELDALLALAEKGCADLTRLQLEALGRG